MELVPDQTTLCFSLFSRLSKSDLQGHSCIIRDGRGAYFPLHSIGMVFVP